MKTFSAKNARHMLFWLMLPSVVFLVSCSPNNMKITEIPIPRNAVRGIADSSYNTPVRTAANVLSIGIQERFEKFDSEISTFNQPTNWQEIGQFYDAELAKYSYVRKTNIPSEAIDADIIFYESSKFGGGKIAVSLFEAVDGSNKTPRQFLLIAVSK